MAHKVRRYSGPLGRQRLEIKTFRCADAMHRFLNRGGNGLVWAEYAGELPTGTYAFAGGAWKDVRTIPPALRPHG